MNFAGFLIPGYYSLDALFSASKVDDTQVNLRIQDLVPPLLLLITCLHVLQWLTVSHVAEDAAEQRCQTHVSKAL